MAELLFQELQPEFVARPSTDLGYDLFAGFRNPRGGINVIAVEVKSTENKVHDIFPIDKTRYGRWANSNIPVLLLVANVKANKLYYHWPSSSNFVDSQESKVVHISLTEIDPNNKNKLREQLAC